MHESEQRIMGAGSYIVGLRGTRPAVLLPRDDDYPYAELRCAPVGVLHGLTLSSYTPAWPRKGGARTPPFPRSSGAPVRTLSDALAFRSVSLALPIDLPLVITSLHATQPNPQAVLVSGPPFKDRHARPIPHSSQRSRSLRQGAVPADGERALPGGHPAVMPALQPCPGPTQHGIPHRERILCPARVIWCLHPYAIWRACTAAT